MLMSVRNLQTCHKEIPEYFTATPYYRNPKLTYLDCFCTSPFLFTNQATNLLFISSKLLVNQGEGAQTRRAQTLFSKF